MRVILGLCLIIFCILCLSAVRTFMRSTTAKCEHTIVYPDICMFSALSLDRVHTLSAKRDAWHGSMAVAIAVSVDDYDGTLRSSLQKISEKSCISLSVLTMDMSRDALRRRFPVNRLRNIAARQCNSKYVTLSDIDFVTKPSLTESIINSIENIFENAGQVPTAVVIPAFSLKVRIPNIQAILESKADLADMILKRQLAPFNMKTMPDNDHELNGFYPVHGPTKYATWLRATTPYVVRQTNGSWPYYYEPYVILKRETLIEFDESFVYYGFNKVSHLHELAARGFQFVVHPEMFTVHVFEHAHNMYQSRTQLAIQHCEDDHDESVYKAVIGHSCIGDFLKRIDCAYNFSLDSLKFSPLRSHEHAFALYAGWRSTNCLKRCVYDIELELQKSAEVEEFTNGLHSRSFIYYPPSREACKKAQLVHRDLL